MNERDTVTERLQSVRSYKLGKETENQLDEAATKTYKVGRTGLGTAHGGNIFWMSGLLADGVKFLLREPAPIPSLCAPN